MKRLLITITVIVITLGSCFGQQLPKREFRGAWIHIVGNQRMKTMTTDEIQQWFIRTLDTLQMTGCNAVIFQVRPQADAFYQSELEPWTRFLTGEQGVAPTPYWDPLEFMVKECHKRGMELHAWLNPYRVTSNDKEQLHPDHLYFKKPELFKRYGKQLYFDPGEPEAIEHTVRVISDIVTRYDIDAVHFDDYFYPYPVKYEEFHDDASFVKYARQQGFEYWQKNDWRRNNVATLMHRINDTIKSIKPWIRFGISPFGIHRNLSETPDSSGSRTNGLSNYEALFADVPDWAQKGYIDYIVPQIYWKIGHPAADYETLIKWWNDGNFGGQLYVGQNISTFNEPDLQNPKTTQMARKMELVRTLEHVDGNVWWPGWSIAANQISIADSLSSKYQKYLSLIPAYTSIDSIPPMGVETLKIKKKSIRWDKVETDDVMQQPHFYIVYRFHANAPIDITDSRNIVKITRDDYYKPTDKRAGKYKYVITVVDKCWNESELSAPIFW
ncbi:MAG: family 10 glycosylhydrolase [Bacteroidales bacterium]|nr:family 10 glycosylhydrolase [Bacteroidales bacterium]MDD4669857.1 family 10 glycosylhydrolase [Bacteroidales bacterium]